MQSVSSSTRTKRVTAGVAAACATALTAGALAAGPQVNASPAESQQAAKTVTLSKKGVKYKCKATSDLVNDIVGGPQQFLVDGSAKFSGTFKPGTKITPKGVKLTLVLPAKLVKKIRKKLHVKKVAGSADVKFDVKSNKGTDKMKVSGLKSGFKKVPRKGTMRIPVTGQAKSYKIAKGTKSLSLLAPKNFMIHAKLSPPVAGAVDKTDLKCKFNGKGRTLGKFPV